MKQQRLFTLVETGKYIVDGTNMVINTNMVVPPCSISCYSIHEDWTMM